MNSIKMIVMDVDGTLTDGSINICADGELFKAFDVKDGFGIRYAQDTFGTVFAIITGRQSAITEQRCRELKIYELYQGISDKKQELLELIKKYNLNTSEVAYIGDDINDIDCMKHVDMSMAPADSASDVLDIAKYVSKKNGGHGFVRECIDYLITNNFLYKKS